MKYGALLFWIGFILNIGIIIAYIILAIIDVICFTTWITSFTLCGFVLVGAILMLIGRTIERNGESL